MSRRDDNEFKKIADALAASDPELARKLSAPVEKPRPTKPSLLTRLSASAEERWYARREGRAVPPWRL